MDTAIFTVEELKNRTIYRRAVEVALWAIPIVQTSVIRNSYFNDFGAEPMDIAFFSKFCDWKFQTTTPNCSTYYFYSAFRTDDEPVVLEVPPSDGASIYGSLCDMWDVPIEVAGENGVDLGKGGKYIFISPDYDKPIPSGHIPVRLNSYGGFWLLRVIPESSSEIDYKKSMELLKKVRNYKLSQINNPPEQKFIDVYGKIWNGIIPTDIEFFEILSKIINEEIVLPRDLAFMEMLRYIGIEKAKPFLPDTALIKTLNQALNEVGQWISSIVLNYTVKFWDDLNWRFTEAATFDTHCSFETKDLFAYDNRALANSFVWAPPQKADPSAPSFYILAFFDKDGSALSGDETYRLKVPVNVPASQYWSLTLYDMETKCFIREAEVLSLDSFNKKTKVNDDGSIDIYISNVPPEGMEDNWIATHKGKNFFGFFRLYGPEKELFDKTWKLNDIEKLNI